MAMVWVTKERVDIAAKIAKCDALLEKLYGYLADMQEELNTADSARTLLEPGTLPMDASGTYAEKYSDYRVLWVTAGELLSDNGLTTIDNLSAKIEEIENLKASLEEQRYYQVLEDDGTG